MTMNLLPPQAYTKEMLAQAYNWLRSQPIGIQEMAKSPDTLVALYQKAQMHGDSYFERPSLKNFKNELKNLAGMMGEFDTQTYSSPQIAPQGYQPPPAAVAPAQTYTQPQAPQPQQTYIQPNQQIHYNPPGFSHNGGHSLALDAKSLGMIQEVKEQFNLGSETEAIRMLIATGFKKINSLL